MTRSKYLLAIALMSVFLTVGLADIAMAEKYRFKVATLAPDKTAWSRHAKNIILKAVQKATDGNVRIKIYWGGIMGDEEQYVTKMGIGQLHGAGFSGQGSTLVCPEIAVVELPFLFNSYEEVDHIKQSMRPVFDGIMRENGYYLHAWLDQDFDQIYSVNKPMMTIEDFQGVRFCIWYGKLEADLIKTLGAIPVPLNVTAIASGVRAGTFDSAIGPCGFVVGSQLYRTMKYINPAKIRYSPSLMVVTTEAWDILPEDYKRRYDKLRDQAMREYAVRVRFDNDRSLEAMYKYGVEKVEFSPSELARIKKKTRKIWDDLAGELYPQELLDEVLHHLEQFRAGGADGKDAVVYAGTQETEIRETEIQETKTATAPPPPVEVESIKPAPIAVSKARPKKKTRRQRIVQIKLVQVILKDLGYYNLKIDGILGPRTFWGIKRYQRDRGLPITGKIDKALLESMGLDK